MVAARARYRAVVPRGHRTQRPDRRRAVAAVVAATVLAGAVPAAALGHGGPTSTSEHFLSSVLAVSPPVSGLELSVADRDDRLVLTNGSSHTVVVQGYSYEPYLRFDAKGVWQNMRSPSRWLDVERRPSSALPAEADAKAAPEWQLVSPGRTWEWHDHRIQYMGVGSPSDTVKPVNGAIDVIDWEVPLQVDGTPTVVSGRLMWYAKANVTPAEAAGGGGGGGTSAVLIAVPAGVAAAVVAGLVLVLRRRRRSAAA